MFYANVLFVTNFSLFLVMILSYLKRYKNYKWKKS